MEVVIEPAIAVPHEVVDGEGPRLRRLLALLSASSPPRTHCPDDQMTSPDDNPVTLSTDTVPRDHLSFVWC